MAAFPAFSEAVADVAGEIGEMRPETFLKANAEAEDAPAAIRNCLLPISFCIKFMTPSFFE
jgi:hypothetical protein